MLAPAGGGALWLLLHLPSLCWGFANPKCVPNTYNKRRSESQSITTLTSKVS